MTAPAAFRCALAVVAVVISGGMGLYCLGCDGAAGGVPAGCVVPEESCAPAPGALLPGGSDLMYSVSASSCSSLTWPWNVGMIGGNPATIFAWGFRIDSRMYAFVTATL